MIEGKFCVIGLGGFGENLVKELIVQGAEVVAIDKDEKQLIKIKDIVSFAISLDTTNENEMKKLGVKDVDTVIVAIGDSFEDSLVTTAILKNIGVKKIIARVINPIHEKLLNALGVTDLLIPHVEIAAHLARQLMMPGLIEVFSISDDYSIFEIKIPNWMIGRTVSEVELRQKYSLNIVTIKHENHKNKTSVMGTPVPSHIFEENDILVLFGKEKDFKKFNKE